MNDAFLNKLIKSIQNHLDDELFGVKELASDIGLSRSQLLRKVKTLCGKSASRFIMEVRLEEAVKILIEKNHSVSEIAYMVGFSSATYFNKCFHKYFGYTPGEVKKKSNENEPLLKKNGNQSNAAEIGPPIKKPPITKNANLFLKRVVPVMAVAGVLITIILFVYWRYRNDYDKYGFPKNQVISIAVLPFISLSDDPDQMHYADGITEAITTELSQISSLRVCSRTSAMKFKGEKKLMSEIARELGVDLLLEGSVFPGGNEIKVTAQLIKPLPHEQHLWAKNYERELQDVLVLVDDIANEIANEINVTITKEEDLPPNTIKKVDPKAYDAYLRGRLVFNQCAPGFLEKSIDYYKQSITLDSGYAPAYCGLAEAYLNYYWGFMDKQKKEEILAKCKFALNNALRLDNKLSNAYIIKGLISGDLEWDWEGMRKMAEKALIIDPNNPFGHYLMARYWMLMGQNEKAINESRLAEKLDPLNPTICSSVAEKYYYARQYDNAIKQYLNILDLSPHSCTILGGLGYAYYQKGMVKEALKSWEKMQSIMGNDSIAYVYSVSTVEESFRYWINWATRSSSQYFSNQATIADVYIMLKEKEEALYWVETACQNHDPGLPMVLVRPEFYPLRNDPRFKLVAQKVGLKTN